MDYGGLIETEMKYTWKILVQTPNVKCYEGSLNSFGDEIWR